MNLDVDDDKTTGEARISIADPVDVRGWCETFNCSASDLLEAVDEVGPIALEVHRFLSDRLPQVPDSLDPSAFPVQKSDHIGGTG